MSEDILNKMPGWLTERSVTGETILMYRPEGALHLAVTAEGGVGSVEAAVRVAACYDACAGMADVLNELAQLKRKAAAWDEVIRQRGEGLAELRSLAHTFHE